MGIENITPIERFTEEVLPLVYDDSLSYYEFLCKVVEKTNEVIEDINTLESEINNKVDVDEFNNTVSVLSDSITDIDDDLTTLEDNFDLFEEQTTTALDGKVDKVEGKGLSENDFTDTDKDNLTNNTLYRHTHDNKTVLDEITQNDINTWNTISSATVITDYTVPSSNITILSALANTLTFTVKKAYRIGEQISVMTFVITNTSETDLSEQNTIGTITLGIRPPYNFDVPCFVDGIEKRFTFRGNGEFTVRASIPAGKSVWVTTVFAR